MKTLKQFPILHRFYTKVLQSLELTNSSYNKLLSDTRNYVVTGKCMCGDSDCATIYMKSDTQNEVLEMLHYDKALIILHMQSDGYIELESLSSTHYPYMQEFIDVFENGLVSPDSEDKAMGKVDSFFDNVLEENLNIIYIE